MSNPKTLMTITVAALLASSALAQDDVAPILEEAPRTIEADFSASDLDQNGALNSDEFVTFSVMRAESGEDGYKDLVLGGEYGAKFNMEDADASGGLTLNEVGGEVDATPIDDDVEGEAVEEEPTFN